MHISRALKPQTLAWQDKRLTLMLSTWHNADTAPHKRWVKGRQEEVEKPVVISDYTDYMGAVDRCDHCCSSYSFTRKTLKWWRKLFFWLLEVSIVNSFKFKSRIGLPSGTSPTEENFCSFLVLLGRDLTNVNVPD